MNPSPPPPSTAYQAPAEHPHTGSDTSLRLLAGLVVGLAAAAIAGALLYRARPQPPRPWYASMRDELAQQLKQLERLAAGVRSEIERG